MKLAIVYTRAQTGIDAPEVTAEVNLARGLPNFSIVGLAETAVKESRDRVRGALQNSQFEVPDYRITVNLAPADLPKEGSRFDLAIAVGLLAASRQIPSAPLSKYEFLGELALSGELRPARGVLASVIQARNSQRVFILPWDNAVEAARIGCTNILGARNLLEVCRFLRNEGDLTIPAVEVNTTDGPTYPDFSDVAGQQHAKRALEVVATGGHNVLLIGPPGTGKTMLAGRLPGILPPLSDDEALESAAIQSITPHGFALATWRQRVWRSPHHSASAVALVGGGNPPRPGEISLAHHGFLFLDELPEFQRRVLEVLREPLESGKIHIARAAHQVTYPARFQLIAAMNPCPCGYLGDPSQRCRCSPDQIKRYRSRVSGPLLDRIDAHIELPRVPPSTMRQHATGESSSQIRARVVAARAIQQARQGRPNALLSPAQLRHHCALKKQDAEHLENIVTKLQLSGRAYHRILKLARSIADLAGSENIETTHVNEAVGYRRLDRQIEY